MKNEKKSYVRISEDKMKAWIFLEKPVEDKPYTKTSVYSLLKENGVVFGIIESKIIAIVKKKVVEREIGIAIGKPVEESKDGYYEFLFDVSGNGNKPEIRQDGTVNYANMSAVRQCLKGDSIAKYFAKQDGESGIDIMNNKLLPNISKDLQPLRGSGFDIVGEGNQDYIANIEGKVEFINGKLEVKKVLIINEDVSYIQEKVEFYGDVIINANVERGVTIRVGKSLTITGSVEPIHITTGGDLILKRGIQGAGIAKVVCKGNMFADFIEHTDVTVTGNLSANIVLNSNINAGGKIEVIGKKGMIFGGYTHADKGIKATSIGNISEIHTVVHVGVTEEYYNERVHLAKKEELILDELNDITKKIGVLAKSNPIKSAKATVKEKFEKLDKEKTEKVEELQIVKVNREKLIDKIESCVNAKIRVENHIYPRSVIGIDENRIPILKSTRSVEYYSDEEGIQSKVVIL